ncbi:MAG: hypothetical protein M3R00_07955, partial [Pseudomonadota bacterium]|nr:hypothetical protein [Pseudomonadota bacterium]
MNILPKEIVNLIALELTEDKDHSAFRAIARFFRQHAAPSKFLCRKIRSFRLIPGILIDKVLQPQTHEDLQKFIDSLPTIKSELTNIMRHSSHAEWVLYALFDKTSKVRECLGHAIANTTDDKGNFVYHYYALAGHWDSFKQHMQDY